MSSSFLRMNGNKNGSIKHSLPYAAGVGYVRPPVDNVPSAFVVDAMGDLLDAELSIETIEEAMKLYLDAHRRKFSGKHGAPRKAQRLDRFVRYLTTEGHSMKLSDLAYEDGQGFMDSLANAIDGRTLGLHSRKRYQGTLRSFGRFLAAVGLIEEDIFFALEAV